MAPSYEDGHALLQHHSQAPTHRRRPSWMALFEGTVPHVSTYLSFREHLTLASTCRTLYVCWPAQSGLKEMGIYLDRTSIPIAAAYPALLSLSSSSSSSSSSPSVPLQQIPTLNNCNRAITTTMVNSTNSSSSSYATWQQQQQQQPPPRQWKSLSRLLQHWSHLETLRFTGAISGPQEDYLQEALVTMPIIFSHLQLQQQQQQHQQQGGLYKLKTVLPQLKKLSFSKIGLFPFNASCIASTLLGSLGSHLLELDLSHNLLKDEGLSTIFKALASSLPDPTTRRRRPSPSFPSSPPPSYSHGLPNLLSFDVSYTHCTSVGLRALHLALRKGGMPLLRSLLLAGNPLKDEGGLVLAAIIEEKKLPFLEHLDTTACGLGPQASRALLDSGRGGREGGMGRVRVLNVGSNYVDSAGVEGLARGMREGGWGGLRCLKLDLSGEGAVGVLAAGWWGSSSGAGGGGGGGGKGGGGREGRSACPDLRRLDLAKNASLSGQAWYDVCVGGREGGREGGLPVGLEELNLAHCKRLGERGLMGLVLWGQRLLKSSSSSSSSLVFLDLSYMGLDGGCVTTQQNLKDLFVVFPCLKTLNLRGNRLGKEGGRALADALKQRSSLPLEVLDVSETGLNYTTVVALLEGLRSSCGAFRELGLGGQNELESPNWEMAMRILGGGGEGGGGGGGEGGGGGGGMGKLRVLDLGRSVLGDFFMRQFNDKRSLVRVLQKVEVLKMAWCNLGPEELAALMEGFENATEGGGGKAMRLTTLDLSYNPQMGEEGARALLHFALSTKMGRLRTLSLVGTGLGDVFIHHLIYLLSIEDIEGWSHLDLIDLRGNGQISKEARVTLQGHVSKLKARLVVEERWGYARRVQGLVRIGSS